MKPWAEKFYGSKAWRTCRLSFLASKDHLCERCSTDENPVVATIAHHIVHLTPENISDPTIALAWSNLEALCQDCHNSEHHGSDEPQRYRFDKQGRVIPI